MKPLCRTWTICKETRLGRIVGLPAVWNGKPAGHVEQAVLTPDGKRLRGVIVRQGMGVARWAAEENVAILGEVSVILRHKPSKLPPGTDFSLSQVKDTGGMQLGWVTDAYVHPITRQVSALEIDLGPIETLRTGRLLARTFSVTEEGGVPWVLVPCGYALERPSDRR